ncbi:hypothetical protein JCM1841_001413 [Sporobolomyces salmonicolor]
MSTLAAKQNEGLDLSDKTAAVAGGTQGIGAAVSARFAEAGADVFIIGRNEDKGKSVVEELRKKGREGKTYEFIKADLSSVNEVRRVAEELERKSGGTIHYLVTTQGGPPNGKLSQTPEGHDGHFAVQTLSRFGLAYLLASSGTLKDSWISVLAPGGSKGAAPELDNIELRGVLEPMWTIRRILKQGEQDGALGDAMTAHFPRAFPGRRAVHLFPGFVHTGASHSAGFPAPLLWAQSLFGPFLARYAPFGNTPASYAEIPVYIAANPIARQGEEGEKLRFSGQGLKGYGMPAWAKDEGKDGVASRTWDKLREVFEGTK